MKEMFYFPMFINLFLLMKKFLLYRITRLHIYASPFVSYVWKLLSMWGTIPPYLSALHYISIALQQIAKYNYAKLV